MAIAGDTYAPPRPRRRRRPPLPGVRDMTRGLAGVQDQVRPGAIDPQQGPATTPYGVTAGNAIGPRQTPPGGAPKPPAAKPPPATPPPVPAPAQVTPDSQYFAEQAQRRFKANQAVAGIDQTAGYDAIDFQEALRRLDEGQPRAQRDLREKANAAGLLYSSRAGEDLGQQATNYNRQRGDQQLAFDRREAERAAARRAIEAGYSIDDAAAYAQAIGRQLERDAAAATAGTLASSAPAGKAGGAGAGSAGRAGGALQVTPGSAVSPMQTRTAGSERGHVTATSAIGGALPGVHDQVHGHQDQTIRSPFTDEQIRQNAIKTAGRRARRRRR